MNGTASSSQRDLSIDDLRGFKQLRRVAGLLSHLHQVGCTRDKAGNRELHFDDYVLLILLYLFNPLITSMRTLQQVSELPEIQRRLSIKRFSLGSFSDFEFRISLSPSSPRHGFISILPVAYGHSYDATQLSIGAAAVFDGLHDPAGREVYGH